MKEPNTQIEQNNPDSDQLLTTDESAPIIGVEPSTLKQSRHSGILFGQPAPEFQKMGRSVRYRLSTLLEFRAQFPCCKNTSEY